ncbi:MAG: 30S ribosomal protein S9 [Candidatus Nealsonbacteria bacterium]|nr:30S ribosomal protein S9 [Candidatus Nealsonbacteria bacterium]
MPKAKPIKKIKATEQKLSFFQAIGRRKTAAARVRLFINGDKEIVVNDRSLASYFPTAELQQIVKEPLEKIDALPSYKVIAQIKGGGVHAQAEALRHGLARALVLLDAEARGKFKKAGLLTRDARMRERKKPGLKRARRAPQWRKR